MIDKYKLIGPDTKPEQFKAVFTGQPIDDSFEPIRWHDDNVSEPLYFINCLIELDLIAHNPDRKDHNKFKSCFVKYDKSEFKENLKQLASKADTNLSKDKRNAIDELLKNFA